VIPGPDLSVHRVGESAAARAADTAEWALRVLADPEACPRAVLHPLGFLCFPLKRGRGVGVCVHVWLPRRAEFAPALATTSIHSHSWDLLSLVLLGRMGNELVDAATSGEAEATHRVYEIRSVRGADEVVPTSRCVRSSRREIRYAGPGEVYQLAGGEFHTSVVEDAGCVATVLLADSRGGVDRSLGPVEPGRAAGPVPRRHAEPTLSKLAIQTVLDRSAQLQLTVPSPPC